MFIVNMAMAFMTVILAVQGVRPMHRIFGPPPAPEVAAPEPDLEAPNEEEDEEGEEERKKRFRRLGAEDCSTNFSGSGHDFTAREKKLLLQIWKNCENYWKINNCEHSRDGRRGTGRVQHYKWRPKDVRAWFAQITGVDATNIGNFTAEMKKNDEAHGPEGWVMPPNRKRKEVNATALEVVLPDLDAFIRDEIKKARKGGHLTVKILAEKATKYFDCGRPIKPQRMKRALKRLGYEYKSRDGKYVNRRTTPENLAKLKKFCEWVFANVTQDERGLYTFKVPVGFGDGANEYTKAFRGRSWVLRMVPELMTAEKGRKKDTGTRLNMLGAIYSHSYDMNSFTTWSSSDKTKNKYCKSSDIVDHTVDHVCPNLPSGTGAVYVLDNAANNKKVEDDLRNASTDEIHDWINEHDLDQARFNAFWKANSEGKTEKQQKAELLRYIRLHIDEFTDLARLLREHDVKLLYLPAYYPECNPIELIWAHIKREFKATDVNLPWKQRLEIAHSKITEEQIDLSFDRSIRYCLDRLVELRDTDTVHGEGVDDHVVYDDEDASDEEAWLNEDEA